MARAQQVFSQHVTIQNKISKKFFLQLACGCANIPPAKQKWGETPPPISALRAADGFSEYRNFRKPVARALQVFILAKCMCDISQILWEVIAIAAQEPRLNNEIRARECRLIAHDGEQLGIYSVARAQQIADDEGFDLVEIAANANPPVCRIMDYAKFKYDQEIKAKQARKKQTKIETKEMKFRPKIDVGDYDTKKKHVLRFLSAGNKVKITIMFRGREMAHPEQGLSILERLSDDLKDVAVVENQPKMEGRNMHMLIAPVPGAIKKKEATPSKKKGKNRRSKDNKVKEKQEKENEDA